jgi:hypothetical protein
LGLGDICGKSWALLGVVVHEFVGEFSVAAGELIREKALERPSTGDLGEVSADGKLDNVVVREHLS